MARVTRDTNIVILQDHQNLRWSFSILGVLSGQTEKRGMLPDFPILEGWDVSGRLQYIEENLEKALALLCQAALQALAEGQRIYRGLPTKTGVFTCMRNLLSAVRPAVSAVAYVPTRFC